MWLDYFRKWAKKYDKETASYGYKPENLIKPFLKEIGKRKMGLDVGCGTGKSLKVIEKFCEKAVGIEPVEKMARQAEKRGFTIFRMQGEDMGRLDFLFDFVSFFASIDFMDEARAAEGCRRLCSKKGVVFMTIEPENRNKIVRTFTKNGFQIIKEIQKRAYKKQDYVCLLMKVVE